MCGREFLLRIARRSEGTRNTLQITWDTARQIVLSGVIVALEVKGLSNKMSLASSIQEDQIN